MSKGAFDKLPVFASCTLLEALLAQLLRFLLAVGAEFLFGDSNVLALALMQVSFC